jgi:acyl-ACP thioesterase
MEFIPFEKEYRIHVYETGPDGKLNMSSLFNYMQDIAAEHAVRLGFGRDDLMKDNRFWVLSRMYATVTDLPMWNDTIIVKTWPNGIDRLFALRNYEASFADGRHVASAISSWLILDQTTKKIIRPDSILPQYNFNPNTRLSHIRYASKLEFESTEGNLTPVFRIKVSDLDVNFHTNNVKYLNWVSDSYDLDFMMNNVPQSIEINYLAESKFDEEIVIRKWEDIENKNIFNHSIYKTIDRKELCRIKIEWKEATINKVKSVW